LFGKSILLSHGDALCTDDLAYQQFRTLVRTKAWQADFLSQPLNTRLTTIAQLRAKSELEKSSKSMQIMDVNLQAVEDLITQFNYPTLLIHGHTHLPNTHKHSVNGHTCERIVLGDWYQQGSYLRVDKNGYHACKV
jgi:UDP-2,3-diacylglucosamine hydrolase